MLRTQQLVSMSGIVQEEKDLQNTEQMLTMKHAHTSGLSAGQHPCDMQNKCCTHIHARKLAFCSILPLVLQHQVHASMLLPLPHLRVRTCC